MDELQKLYENIIKENDDVNELPAHTILPPRIITDKDFENFVINKLIKIQKNLEELYLLDTPLWSFVGSALEEARKYVVRGSYKSKNYPVTESVKFLDNVFVKLMNIKSYLKYLDMEDSKLANIINMAIKESDNPRYK